MHVPSYETVYEFTTKTVCMPKGRNVQVRFFCQMYKAVCKFSSHLQILV